MPSTPWYRTSSPGSLLRSTQDFIIHLNDIATNFGLPENEITNLQLATAELKNKCEKARDNRLSLQTAGAEKTRRMQVTRNVAAAILKLLKSNPNWTNDCDEAGKLGLLLHKVDNTNPEIEKRGKGNYYSSERHGQIMTQLKYLQEILTTSEQFVVPGFDLETLQAAIAAADQSINTYKDIYHLQTKLSAEQNISLIKIKSTIKSVVNYLQQNKAWTSDYALLLNVQYLTSSQKIVKCTPVFEVRDSEKYVCINFAKIGINGMNVYTRAGGEIDFTFLGYIKRTGYKDPRPINPYVAETREYRLNAVVAGKEIGEPSEIKSIRVGGFKEARTLPWN